MALTVEQERALAIAQAKRARAEAEAATAEPAAEPPPETGQSGLREGIRALTGSALESIPIAGPAIRGGADRLAALKRSFLDDVPYEESLQKIQGEMPGIVERHPYASTAGNVIGAVAGSAPMVALAPEAFGAAGGPLAARMLASGSTNLGVGAADAYVRGQDPTTGAVVGGLFGALAPPLGQAAGAGVRKVLGKTAAAQAPTIEAQRLASKADYDLSKAAGVAVKPTSFASAVGEIETVARGAGIDPGVTPAATAALTRLQKATAAPGQTLEELDTLRKVIGGVAKSPNPAEQNLAHLMADRLDDYLDALTPADITAGDTAVGVQALKRAREGWRVMRKSEIIAKVLADADLDASTVGMDTALKNQFKALAKSKKMNSFSPAEQDAIRHVVKGDPAERVLRLLGKAAPRGVVSMLPTLFASNVDLGAGAAVGLAGEAAKRGSNAMAQRNAGLVDALVRAGGQMPATPASPMSDATRRMVELLTMGTPTAIRASGE